MRNLEGSSWNLLVLDMWIRDLKNTGGVNFSFFLKEAFEKEEKGGDRKDVCRIDNNEDHK